MPLAVFFLSAIAISGASSVDLSSSCQEPECAAVELHSGSAQSLLQRTKSSTKTHSSNDGLEGLLAPLNDAGFSKVAATSSREQMNHFLRRTATSMGLHITSLAKLRDVVPHYFSEAGRPESFLALQAEIVKATEDPHGSWVASLPSGASTNPSLSFLSHPQDAFASVEVAAGDHDTSASAAPSVAQMPMAESDQDAFAGVSQISSAVTSGEHDAFASAEQDALASDAYMQHLREQDALAASVAEMPSAVASGDHDASASVEQDALASAANMPPAAGDQDASASVAQTSAATTAGELDTTLGSMISFGAEALLGPEAAGFGTMPMGMDEEEPMQGAQVEETTPEPFQPMPFPAGEEPVQAAHLEPAVSGASRAAAQVEAPVIAAAIQVRQHASMVSSRHRRGISIIQGQAAVSTLQEGSSIRGVYAGQETGLGTHAALNEDGFELVLQMQNSHELQTFCRRIIEDLGLKVVNQDGLASMASQIGGAPDAMGFGNFKGKVLNLLGTSNAWVVDPLQPESPQVNKGRDAKFTEEMGPGPLPFTDDMGPASRMAFTEEMGPASRVSLFAEDGEVGIGHGIGSYEAMTEEGYRKVANQRSNSEMAHFIARVVESMGFQVTNHGGVQGLAPFFSGDKQVGSLAGLRSEVMKASKAHGSWVGPRLQGPNY